MGGGLVVLLASGYKTILFACLYGQSSAVSFVVQEFTIQLVNPIVKMTDIFVFWKVNVLCILHLFFETQICVMKHKFVL